MTHHPVLRLSRFPLCAALAIAGATSPAIAEPTREPTRDRPVESPPSEDTPSRVRWTGDGLALYLSGGTGMLTSGSLGGGAMVGLTVERKALGFGVYGAGVGASGDSADPAVRDFAVTYSAGALAHWVPGEGSILPLVSLGLGYGKLALNAPDTLRIYEGSGPMLLMRGGITSRKSNLFAAVRFDVPMFQARDDVGDEAYALGVTAEVGLRFGG